MTLPTGKVSAVRSGCLYPATRSPNAGSCRLANSIATLLPFCQFVAVFTALILPGHPPPLSELQTDITNLLSSAGNCVIVLTVRGCYATFACLVATAQLLL